MKFWALVSTFREEKDVLMNVIIRPEWELYFSWYKNYDTLVKEQKRELLDAEMPVEFCLSVLSACNWKFTLCENRFGQGKVLARVLEDDESCVMLTATDVYMRFGGDSLADIQEYGVCYIHEK